MLSPKKFHAFEREITKIAGKSNFSSFFALEFFLRRTYTLQSTVFKFGIFPGSFTIFRGLCAFSRHLAHMDPIQLQVHGCDARDVDFRSIAAHPTVHTRAPRGWGSSQS